MRSNRTITILGFAVFAQAAFASVINMNRYAADTQVNTWGIESFSIDQASVDDAMFDGSTETALDRTLIAMSATVDLEQLHQIGSQRTSLHDAAIELEAVTPEFNLILDSRPAFGEGLISNTTASAATLPKSDTPRVAMLMAAH